MTIDNNMIETAKVVLLRTFVECPCGLSGCGTYEMRPTTDRAHAWAWVDYALRAGASVRKDGRGRIIVSNPNHRGLWGCGRPTAVIITAESR